MVHGILQFTLRIAFRCVLHRYESQDIRCTQLSLVGYSGQADCISTLDWFCLVLMLIETNLLTRRLTSPLRLQVNAAITPRINGRPDSLVHSVGIDRFNDPSAGSPTETLLRLLLPLGGRV